MSKIVRLEPFEIHSCEECPYNYEPPAGAFQCLYPGNEPRKINSAEAFPEWCPLEDSK